MPPDLSEWKIEGGWTLWVFAIFCLGTSVILSYRTWKNSDQNLRVGLWEVFRTLILLLILVALFNPQRVQVLNSQRKPQVICLLDESQSMRSADLVVDGQAPRQRLDWSQSFLQEEWRKELEKNASVSVRTFSSSKGSQETDIAGALAQTLEETKDLKAILLITDGDTNSGPSVLSVAGSCRASSVPVFSLITGAEKPLPDLALEEVFAPSFALQEERVTLTWRASNSFEEKKIANLSLWADGKEVMSKAIGFNPLETRTGNLSWLPPSEGTYELELVLEELKGETFPENNAKSTTVRVERKVIRVLLVDSFPRWEYRFLRNALKRDPGVKLDSILYHPDMGAASGDGYLNGFPDDESLLAPYDVIILGDVGMEEGELSPAACELVENLIRYQAAGVVFLPGRRGSQLSFQSGPLETLLPVVYDSANPRGLGTRNPVPLALTQRGKEHWLTNLRGAGEPNRDFWSRLPGFHWSAMVTKSRPGSEVLGVHSNFVTDWGKMPILAIRKVGSGKSLYLGSDSAWRWRRGVEDKYHYRFWSQVVRWMAHGRYLAEKEGIRVIPDPENPRVGERVFLRTIVLDENGFPLESGTVNGRTLHPKGRVETLSFSPDPDSPGVFLSSFLAGEVGEMKLRIVAKGAKREIESVLRIEESVREKLGKPVVSEPLIQLGKLSQGKALSHTRWKELTDSLALAPAPKPIIRIERLRTQFSWGIMILVLLAIYWTGRKLFGMV